jgi:hypothetical protein
MKIFYGLKLVEKDKLIIAAAKKSGLQEVVKVSELKQIFHELEDQLEQYGDQYNGDFVTMTLSIERWKEIKAKFVGKELKK